MNLSGRLWRRRSDFGRPGADFFDARSEIGLQTEQCVSMPDHTIQARFVKPEVGQEVLFVFVIQQRDLSFNRRTDADNLCTLVDRILTNSIEMRVVLKAILINVGDVHDRLVCDQVNAQQNFILQIGFFQRANRQALVEVSLDPSQRIAVSDSIFLAGLCRSRCTIKLPLYGLEVGQCQFGVDRLDIVDRIDLSCNVCDVVVLKTTHNVSDCVGLTDISQKLITEPLTFRRASDEPRDIHELHRRRQNLLRFDDPGQNIKTRIRNGNDADIRLNGAERIILSRNLGRSERIEQC